jgi:histidinol-phosphate phosphatase family protein
MVGPVTGVRAVLLDRDGTLVVDVPYNGDPGRVAPVDGAADAVAALRDAGLALAVVTNQSGIGRGMITARQVDAVNARIDRLIGPLGPWVVCPHAPDAGCECRKPKPGLVVRAAALLGVPPAACVVVGDRAADVGAAAAAGARSILVPSPATGDADRAAAPVVADSLRGAVDLILDR